jgi:hypothetical protein
MKTMQSSNPVLLTELQSFVWLLLDAAQLHTHISCVRRQESDYTKQNNGLHIVNDQVSMQICEIQFCVD